MATPLFGCPSDSTPTLQVDVRTDYVPQEDFDAIRIELGGGDLQINLEHIVNRLGDYVRGQRVGSAEVALGDLPLAARLVRDGVTVASREVVTRVGANVTTVTVVITRDCSGVSCPDPGGDTSLRSCYGGRCADPVARWRRLISARCCAPRTQNARTAAAASEAATLASAFRWPAMKSARRVNAATPRERAQDPRPTRAPMPRWTRAPARATAARSVSAASAFRT